MKYFCLLVHDSKYGIPLLLFACWVSLNVWSLDDVAAQIPESSIEIIVDGRKYESMDQYRYAKKRREAFVKEMIVPSLVSKNFMTPLFYFISSQHYRSNTKESLWWNKWIQTAGAKDKLNEDVLWKKRKLRGSYDQFLPAFAAMSKVGFNTGVMRMIEAFQERDSRTISYKIINPKDLEDALSESFPDGGYSGPILMISDKNKVRILTLEDAKKTLGIDAQ